jgi:hypothetical protein
MGSSIVTHLLCIIKNYRDHRHKSSTYIQKRVLVGLQFYLLGGPTGRQVARDPHVLVVEAPVEVQEVDEDAA